MQIILGIAGGLGLFLYGMNLMGDGLQKAAGNKLKNIIGILTKNTFTGILVGTFVTMLIQSSSATTVMVVGFVNAGLMTLYQAAGVIFGANIGTTITGQILVLNISKYAPIAILAGVAVMYIGKNKKAKSWSEILLGLGILFTGMSTMGAALKPLGEMPEFLNFIMALNNQWIALATGVIMTTILQSSSAAQAVILALAAQNLITMEMAFPILFGQNIGTTTTAMISAIGANKTAKQAAFIHFIFNVFGSIVFILLLRRPVQDFVVSTFKHTNTQIAMAHTFFNVINVLWMAPFTKVLVKMAEKVLPDSGKKEEKYAIHLDYRILRTPALALETVVDEIKRMASLVLENIKDSKDMLIFRKEQLGDKIYEREHMINNLQKEIIDYLIKLSTSELSQSQHKEVDDLFYIVNDVERAGDHVKNIAELSIERENHDFHFSTKAKEELGGFFDMCIEIFKLAVNSYTEMDEEKANEVKLIEEKIDSMEEYYRENHMRRLMKDECKEEPGIIFLDTISNLERIGDHSDNIAGYVLKHFKE